MSTRQQDSTSGSSSGRYQGKVAVITASTQGIGKAIAIRLGREGAHVVISSRKKDMVEAAGK